VLAAPPRLEPGGTARAQRRRPAGTRGRAPRRRVQPRVPGGAVCCI